MGTVHVGCVNFNTKPARYAKRLSFVELSASFENIPRKPAMLRIREEAGPNMVIALRAHHWITHPASTPIYDRIQGRFPGATPAQYGFFQDTHPVKDATARLFAAAGNIGARALVFETPVEFTPTRENQARLIQYFSKIERGALLLVWEPRGPWDLEQAQEAAKAAGVVLAAEPFGPQGLEPELRSDGTGAIYLRMRGPSGRRRRYAPYELEELALLCRGYETCFAAFSHASATGDAVAFRAALEQAPASELLDEDDEEE